jgi:UDP-2,3-diacylglucosamine pyrophosphatase LpxH
MRLAIASDLHLGDTTGRLVRQVGDGWEPGPAYPQFREFAGADNDYLVLLGDIFDLSVSDFDGAYGAAEAFFRAVHRDGVARQVIYVPGNHDFSVWNLLSQEINVIKQVEDDDPIKTRMAKPGVLLEAPAPGQRELTLADANPDPVTGRYGGLFLDHLATDGDNGAGVPLTFNVAFPNLYFVPAEGPPVLMTHGHFFERYWSLVGEFALAVAGPDLKVERPGRLDIEEWCRVNCPLNELASASLGQTGPLVDVIHRVQKEVNHGRTPHTRRYVRRTAGFLRAELGGGPLTRLLIGFALKLLERFAIRKLTRRTSARGHGSRFFRQPDVQARIAQYLDACRFEMASLPVLAGRPAPQTLLCGHTHHAIGPDAAERVPLAGGASIRVLNAGAWLPPDDARDPFPGAVFRYRSGEGFTYFGPPAPPEAANGAGGDAGMSDAGIAR